MGGTGKADTEVSSLPPEELESGKISPEIATTTGSGGQLKLIVDRSFSSSVPALTHSLISAAKNAAFPSRSLSSPPFYGAEPWEIRKSGHMKLVQVVLRFASVVLSLITFSVMAAASEIRSGAGSTFKTTYSDFQAYNYLVAINVISCIYSSWQLILLVQSRTRYIFSSEFKWRLCVYICDQILAFLLFSASSSAATAAELSRHGLNNIWPPACSTWELWIFCSKADGAVVMSFISSFCVILTTIFSGYILSKSAAE